MCVQSGANAVQYKGIQVQVQLIIIIIIIIGIYIAPFPRLKGGYRVRVEKEDNMAWVTKVDKTTKHSEN